MIRICQHIIQAIIRQAQDELPHEACGLLAGSGDTVVKQFPMTNIDHSAEHFSFDPREQFHVLNTARKEGLRIIANYHSHPSTPSRPSEEDIRLAYDPDIIYLIVSLAAEEPVVRAFRIRDGKAKQEDIIIT
ncbi:MAG: M67 family metallopeptidase [Tannerellaceae bacterium]|jgi:proteasome lid subunit RPN8/RPN11|nr:M67 family metallopeptidase [Tannerellaceae bacterium]